MLPTKPPGPKTGLVSPNCYAAPLLDCDGEKATREHYISSTLLKRFGALHVDGLSWAEGTQQLTARTMTAKVLCERHNNALSALDAFIGEFDDVLTAGLQGDAGAHVFDGEDLERWALKVLLGLGVSGNLAASGVGEKLGPRVPELYLRILFGEEALPERCGFFYVGDPIKLMDGDALNVKFMTYPEGDPEVGKVYGVILKLRFFTFVMSVTNSLSPVLNVPDSAGGLTKHRLSYRPNGFILGEKGDRGRIGLRWDQMLSGDNVLVLKMAPPNLDQGARGLRRQGSGVAAGPPVTAGPAPRLTFEGV